MADSSTFSVIKQELAKKIVGIKYIIAIKQILPCDTSSEQLELYDFLRVNHNFDIRKWVSEPDEDNIKELQSLADRLEVKVDVNSMREYFY